MGFCKPSLSGQVSFTARLKGLILKACDGAPVIGINPAGKRGGRAVMRPDPLTVIMAGTKRDRSKGRRASWPKQPKETVLNGAGSIGDA